MIKYFDGQEDAEAELPEYLSWLEGQATYLEAGKHVPKLIKALRLAMEQRDRAIMDQGDDVYWDGQIKPYNQEIEELLK